MACVAGAERGQTRGEIIREREARATTRLRYSQNLPQKVTSQDYYVYSYIDLNQALLLGL